VKESTRKKMPNQQQNYYPFLEIDFVSEGMVDR
jgi:hypothetical protein